MVEVILNGHQRRHERAVARWKEWYRQYSSGEKTVKQISEDNHVTVFAVYMAFKKLKKINN